MPGFYLTADWSAVERELDRLSRMPDAKMVAALDAGLQDLFEGSQAIVDIDTGSLKSSGRADSKVNDVANRWTGEIKYGGSSQGVNNPVDYAWYEQRRGDTHDFMRSIVALSDTVMGNAIEGVL